MKTKKERIWRSGPGGLGAKARDRAERWHVVLQDAGSGRGGKSVSSQNINSETEDEDKMQEVRSLKRGKPWVSKVRGTAALRFRLSKAHTF